MVGAWRVKEIDDTLGRILNRPCFHFPVQLIFSFFFWVKRTVFYWYLLSFVCNCRFCFLFVKWLTCEEMWKDALRVSRLGFCVFFFVFFSKTKNGWWVKRVDLIDLFIKRVWPVYNSNSFNLNLNLITLCHVYVKFASRIKICRI
jgi:hypothetical protein